MESSKFAVQGGCKIFGALIFITAVTLGTIYVSKIGADKSEALDTGLFGFGGTIVITVLAGAIARVCSNKIAEIVFGLGAVVAFLFYILLTVTIFMEANDKEKYRDLGYAAGVFSALNIIPMGVLCYTCASACGSKDK